MAAEEVSSTVTRKKWTLNVITDFYDLASDAFEMGLSSHVQQFPAIPAGQQFRIQVDLPNKPTAALLATQGDYVIMIGDNVNTLEKLSPAEYDIRYPA